MFRQRQAKTHGRLMREELVEGIGHLRLAAAHAAGGASDIISPRAEAAREAVGPALRSVRSTAGDGMDSFFEAARRGSRNVPSDVQELARRGRAKVTKRGSVRMAKKRWSMMFGGLLVAGAAAGAATALMRRRRARRAWDEYGDTEDTGGRRPAPGAGRPSADAGVDTVSPSAQAARDRTSDLVGSRAPGNTPAAVRQGEDKQPSGQPFPPPGVPGGSTGTAGS